MATVTPATVDDVLATVAGLEPLIRKHASEAERQRRLSKPVVDALREAGLFRMYRPQSRNGLELDAVSMYRVIEAVARIDSAAGWNVAIANAGEAFGGWLSEAASEKVFNSPDAVTAGGFNPPRKAVSVDGGYRVTGRTTFNSNCHAANWITGLAHVYDGDTPRVDENGAPVTLLTYIPAEQTEIIENWNTMGMCGTGSHDVNVEDVFVPEEHAPLFVPIEQPAPSYDVPMHRLAVWSAVTCNAVTILGIAQAAIDDLIELGVKVPAYTERSMRDRNAVQLNLAKAAALVESSRALLHRVYGDAWATAVSGRGLEMRERARCQMAASNLVIACAEAVRLVHACVGASGIRNEQQFQRYFRDAHVITQHAFICEARLESVGQVMLGLEPEWPFFQM